jgi:hypothetical protein
MELANLKHLVAETAGTVSLEQDLATFPAM